MVNRRLPGQLDRVFIRLLCFMQRGFIFRREAILQSDNFRGGRFVVSSFAGGHLTRGFSKTTVIMCDSFIKAGLRSVEGYRRSFSYRGGLRLDLRHSLNSWRNLQYRGGLRLDLRHKLNRRHLFSYRSCLR